MNWNQFYAILKQKFSLAWLLLMVYLSFQNRFLEILKWQNLVSSFQKISVSESTKQVLAALAGGIVTPNGIGEYAGKAMYYEASRTKRIIFLNLVCNGIQMIISILFGIIGLFIIGYSTWSYYILGTLVVGLIIVLLFRNFEIKKVSITLLIQKINEIPKKILQKNNLLGLARYLTFSHQYYFLFLIFDVQLPYLTLMGCIAAVYFVASSLPSFQFFDFSVKGGVSLYFFSQYHIDSYVIFFISIFMWLFNVAIPVLIGCYYVLRFKNKS